MKNSLWKKHISTVVEINGHIYEIQLVAIFCSHMSHHQLEDGRAEMNNHAFPHIILGSTYYTLSVLLTLKSINLQYNMLGRWVNGTNDSSTKHLMFQVLFFS